MILRKDSHNLSTCNPSKVTSSFSPVIWIREAGQCLDSGDFTRCRLFNSDRLLVAAHCLQLQRQAVYEESFFFFFLFFWLLNIVTLAKCNRLFRITVTNCIWSEVKHTRLKAITFCATGVDTSCSFYYKTNPVSKFYAFAVLTRLAHDMGTCLWYHDIYIYIYMIFFWQLSLVGYRRLD